MLARPVKQKREEQYRHSMSLFNLCYLSAVAKGGGKYKKRKRKTAARTLMLVTVAVCCECYGNRVPCVAQACQRPSRLIHVSVKRILRSYATPLLSFPFT